MAYKPRTEAQKAARRLRAGGKVRIRTRGYPPVDMTKHKTGDALIEHIRAFDKARGLRAGNVYLIGGKEVVI